MHERSIHYELSDGKPLPRNGIVSNQMIMLPRHGLGSILCWCQFAPVAYGYIQCQPSIVTQHIVGESSVPISPTDFATESILSFPYFYDILTAIAKCAV